jgi:UPF0755 protein
MKRIIKFKYRVLVLFVEISTLILITLLIYNFLSNSTKPSTFYLKESNIQTLLNTLEKNGYKTYTLDALVLKFLTLPPKGWYHISPSNVGRFSFFQSLYSKRAKTMQVKIFAGETSIELTKRLANDMKLDNTKLLMSYKKQSIFKEADIFSGRYTLARDADEDTTITYLFDISNDILKAFEKIYCKRVLNKLEIKVLLIIASIIQKESNSIEEMPLISSVIYNRLEKNMRLQMDGTLNYGKFAHTIVTSERIKTDESAYNTYKHKGIPPAPLGTVSIEALEAAYHPARSKYLFFMLKKDGSHQFAQTYEEHLKNIRAFKSKTQENNVTKIEKTKNIKEKTDANVSL